MKFFDLTNPKIPDNILHIAIILLKILNEVGWESHRFTNKVRRNIRL